MRLSEFLKKIENKIAEEETRVEIIDGKQIEKKVDPEINIGFELKGRGTQYHKSFDIEYEEVFTRDENEILITLRGID
tara:strand:- start:382 stop:615 length:234 start_codon:yes stop_codon:yes gene_type:complete